LLLPLTVAGLECSCEDLRICSQRLGRSPHELEVLVRDANVVVLVVNATEEQTVEADLS
jgi:hypothetical protein